MPAPLSRTFMLRRLLFAFVSASQFATFQGQTPGLELDGGPNGWAKSKWYIQADTVMGGRSSGSLDYLSNNCPQPEPAGWGSTSASCQALHFSGDISLTGGGFNSIRKTLRPTVDMSAYGGIELRLDALGAGATPAAYHLRVVSSSESNAWWATKRGHAFVAPERCVNAETGATVKTCTLYLPFADFAAHTRSGYSSDYSGAPDVSSVDELNVYLLFQEGPFDLTLRSMRAVPSTPDDHTPPALPTGNSLADAQLHVQKAINTGVPVFNKGYSDLCSALYESAARAVVQSMPASAPASVVVAQALEGLYDLTWFDRAWALRRAFDQVLAMTDTTAAQPTAAPTPASSPAPTPSPTRSPTTRSPTGTPTAAPTARTPASTAAPTRSTPAATPAPTSSPTGFPTAAPMGTPSPSAAPTLPPTASTSTLNSVPTTSPTLKADPPLPAVSTDPPTATASAPTAMASAANAPPSSGVPACSSSRPGGGGQYSRRVLYLPAAALGAAEERAQALAGLLCCVYTHVEAAQPSIESPFMRTYDGGIYRYSAELTAVEVMTMVYDDICGMPMGSTDCETQRSCVQEALASTTASPTESPSASAMQSSPTTTPPTAAERLLPDVEILQSAASSAIRRSEDMTFVRVAAFCISVSAAMLSM